MDAKSTGIYVCRKDMGGVPVSKGSIQETILLRVEQTNLRIRRIG